MKVPEEPILCLKIIASIFMKIHKQMKSYKMLGATLLTRVLMSRRLRQIITAAGIML